MKIKALSVQQPWASEIARQEKQVEYRDWYTPYRGPLLIVATKAPVVAGPDGRPLPTGEAVCVVELLDVDDDAGEWKLGRVLGLRPGWRVRGRLGLYEVDWRDEYGPAPRWPVRHVPRPKAPPSAKGRTTYHF